MHQVIGQCPICGDELTVTRLQCHSCGTHLEGQYSLGAWYRLNHDQLALLQSFLRNQGKITWVAEELDLSYPTVRARLMDILHTLGLEPQNDSPASDRQRARDLRYAVLADLSNGLITTAEAESRLQAISD